MRRGRGAGRDIKVDRNQHGYIAEHLDRGTAMTGAEFKQARLARNLSRRALAERCGLHPDSIRYWEHKAVLDVRGYAPKRMFAALNITIPEPSRRRIFRNRALRLGNMCTLTLARGVLSRCRAKTRSGAPCRAKPVPGKIRCKFHGGASTGPKTPEGRARIAEAQRLRWARWRRDRV